MNALSTYQKGLLAVFVAAVLWSSSGLFIKLITFDALQISFFRSLLAAGVFVLLFGKRLLRLSAMTLLNALFYAGVLLFFVMATKLTTAANAIFLQYTAPIYVLLLEPWLLKTRYERANFITIGVCFAGMFLFFQGDLEAGHQLGNLLALLSGVCLAAFMLGMRRNGPENQLPSIFWGNTLLALVTLPSLWSLSIWPTADLLMVAYLGIVQVGLAYAIFSYGLQRVSAVEAALIAMVEPVLNPLWVLLVLGEVPSRYALLGGAIILGVVAWRSVRVSRSAA